jgi:hypothetical protein
MAQSRSAEPKTDNAMKEARTLQCEHDCGVLGLMATRWTSSTHLRFLLQLHKVLRRPFRDLPEHLHSCAHEKACEEATQERQSELHQEKKKTEIVTSAEWATANNEEVAGLRP